MICHFLKLETKVYMIKSAYPNYKKYLTDLITHYDVSIGAKHREIRNILISIIFEAATKLRHSTHYDISSKGIRDFVTQVDIDIETIIINQVASQFPDHGILGEETGQKGESSYKWIIDPIDGTLNFATDIPFFAISIGILKDEEFLLGAIFDPIHDELFFSQNKGGAWVNKHRVSVSKSSTLITSSLGLDLSYEVDKALENISLMHHLMPHIRTQRVLGSAALGLAYVGCGRLDGYYHNQVMPWDAAAGTLFVNEAGGKITNFYGNNLGYTPEKTLVASNGIIHDELIAIINRPEKGRTYFDEKKI
jgi:myo-inositol-1(or 4)-monophosphatase